MYQQYQQYRDPSSSSPHGGASTETVAKYWNGSSWELRPAAPGTAATASGSSSSSNNNPTNTTSIPENPVATYTRYYHKWMECWKDYTQQFERLNRAGSADASVKTDLEQRIEWAKYYADESSRAAHYFYQNPQAATDPATRANMTFSLPPAPPNLYQQSNDSTPQSQHTLHSAQSNSNPQQQQQQQQYQHQEQNSTEQSLARYMKRCLDRCTTSQQREVVQEQIELRIAKAILEQDNNPGTGGTTTSSAGLNGKNWDLEPLIPIPATAGSTNTGGQNSTFNTNATRPWEQTRTYQQDHNSNNDGTSAANATGYYGPASSGTYPTATTKRATYSSASYGGAGAATAVGNTTAVQNSFANNYYGPASSSSSSQLYPTESTHQSQLSHSYHDSFSHHRNNSTENNSSTQFSYYGNPSHAHIQQREQPPPEQEEDFIAFSNSKKQKKKKSPKHYQQQQLQQQKHNSSTTFGTTIGSAHGFETSQGVLNSRKARFSTTDKASMNQQQLYDYYGYTEEETENSDGLEYKVDGTFSTLKGTCLILEKEYLRLTAPPQPERVRPKFILERHVNNLKQEYYGKTGEYSADSDNSGNYNVRRVDHGQNKRNKRKRDYLWFCSQLKAVRQDLTIQRIRDDFAMQVYELHARIALQEGDLNEFNQCQTQLKELYELVPTTGAKGTNNLKTESKENDSVVNKSNSERYRGGHDYHPNQEEFVAYRLLYHVFLTTNDSYAEGSSPIYKILASLCTGDDDDFKDRNKQGQSQQHSPAIDHALQVREAVAASDYLQFFRLHRTAPNLGGYLTSRLVPTMRFRALSRIVKAYRPSIPVKVCTRIFLGFDAHNKGEITNGKEDDVDDTQGLEYLQSCGCIIKDGTLLTKESEAKLHHSRGNKPNSLI